MGSISGRKALHILNNVEKILAIELLTAAQAFEFRKPLKSGILLDNVHQFLRTKVPFADQDRVFADDIEIALTIIQSGAIPKLINQTMCDNNMTWNTLHREAFETY
jgi:histidine ammonia-lyase